MILRGSIFSKTLEMETGLTILAPAHVENRALRVVYLLHGLCGSHSSWVDYTMLPAYGKSFGAVFIMPEVGRSFYTDMKYGLDYFTYITEELPQRCAALFNISAERKDTAVIGASMGGYGALKCAMSRPDLYGTCAAFAPACLELKQLFASLQTDGGRSKFKATYGNKLLADFDAAFGEKYEWDAQYEIIDLAKELAQRGDFAPKPKIYMACGIEDKFQPENRRFSRQMQELPLDYTYEEWSGAHSWSFFDEALLKALQRLYQP